MRRQLFAVTFVAIPLAVALSATIENRAPAGAQATKAPAHRPV